MTQPSCYRRAASLSQSLSRALSSNPPCSVVGLLLVAATLIAAAEAGPMGGRSVPWWYPSREWAGGASDGYDAGRGAVGGEGDGDGIANGWVAGSSQRRFREEAKAAREFVQLSVARGVAEAQESTEALLQCSIHEASNHTLKSLGASVDRCASPYYSLTEIHPSQLVYTEVDAAEEAAKEEARRKAAEAGRAGSRGGEGAAHAGEDSEEPAREDTFLAIFLFIKGDFFSVELENALTAVAPAYPRAWIVKADAPSFLSFCVQYQLHTYPQLLLFKNGHLVSRYRENRSPEDLAAWLSMHTGDLPRAIPRRALPPPPPPHPLSPPGSDEPLAWAALLYAAVKVVNAILWFVKRRRKGAAREAERTRGARLAGCGQWLVSVFLRRGGRQGRRRVVGIEGAGAGAGGAEGEAREVSMRGNARDPFLRA